MAKQLTTEAELKILKKETFVFKPDHKHKMDKDELQMHLHLQRKGAAIHKDDSKYKRKPKHRRTMITS